MAADKLIAGAALVLLFPVIATVALLIRLTDGGSIVFGHPRVGTHGRIFKCYKFRTMIPDGDEVLEKFLAENPSAAHEWNETRKLTFDPRVTPIGRFLRRTSLDELPQLVNVLRGDMSCVGPRPVVEAELPNYGSNVVDYLASRPGMTGLWQISGRSNLSYAERVKLDALYVRKWTFILDMVIMLKTIPAVLRSRGAV